MSSFWLRLCLAVALACGASPAFAKVKVTFFAHELGNDFPHAFIVAEGKIDATGEAVKRAIGFTPKSVSPSMLFGSVAGMMDIITPSYIQHSYPHFSLEIDDAAYARMLAEAERWRVAGQPNYNLNHRNCVHFVGALARALGLDAPDISGLMKRPRSYLIAVAGRNRGRVTPIGN